MNKWLVALVGLLLVAVPVFAGSVYTNDSGIAAKAFRIVFSESVTITSFGGSFTVQEPEGEADKFTFTNGEAKVWDSFWLSWTPESATVVKVVWLAEAPPVLSDIIEIPADRTEIAEEIPVRLKSIGVASDGTTAPDLTLIDGFNNPAHTPTIGGSYKWGSGEGAGSTASCKLSWIADGPGEGHLKCDYSYPHRTWLKFGLVWIPNYDASNEDGVELALWSTADETVEIEIGTTHAGQWFGYRSPALHVDTSRKTFRVPFSVFRPYGDSDQTGILADHLSSLVAINLFPSSHRGTLNLDDLALYYELATLPTTGRDGDLLAGTITRYTSYERFPFSIRYATDFPQREDLTYEWRVYAHRARSSLEDYVVTVPPLSTSSEADPTFVLDSNSDTYDVELKVIDGEGQVYTWENADIDIPLHNETTIRLDATKYVPLEDIASVEWNASNWDPADSATFPIVDPHAPMTTLTSVWPNDLNIGCRIEKKDGTVVEKNSEALIYFRNGTPFEIRATAASLLGRLTQNQFNNIMKQIFPLLHSLGINSITTAINWRYGYPDSNGNFNIHPLYTDSEKDVDPRGYTPSLDELATYFDTARDSGFGVFVELRHWPYQNDAKLRQEWGSGWGPNNWFKETDGWLYGDGHGLKHNLLYYIDFFINHKVDSFFWDAESGDVEVHGGYKTRKFITDEIIHAYRKAGYTGDISYALSYFQRRPEDLTSMTMNLENLNPYVCGIPWGSDEIPYLGITFYPTLATTNDVTTEEMYQEALRQINKYLVPFSEIYNKPIFIEDCYCGGYDGASIITNDTNLARTRSADFGEQLSWHAAILRAFAHENQTRASPLIKGLTIAIYELSPDKGIINRPSWDSTQTAILNECNGRKDLQNLVKVYLSDKPLQ